MYLIPAKSKTGFGSSMVFMSPCVLKSLVAALTLSSVRSEDSELYVFVGLTASDDSERLRFASY